MKNRLYLLLLFLLFSMPINAQVNGADAGITPIYDGDTGIRAKIIQSKCLGCHLSTLQEGQRNGAPIDANFDTFEGAKIKGDEIIERAVTLSNMPPSGSLSDEEKQALSNWQALGFPESTMPAHYFPATQMLEIPEVFIINEDGGITTKVKTGLLLVPPFAEPFRFEIQQLEVLNVEGEGSQ